VEHAGHLAAIDHLLDRRYGLLSCPEKRRVQFARAIVRAIYEETIRCVWLDEPDADLDVVHQFRFMKALRILARERELGIVCTLHEKFCSRM
jgi:ABC-type hemin transport system ATPase subunit